MAEAWRSLGGLPRDEIVEVLTVKGLERRAIKPSNDGYRLEHDRFGRPKIHVTAVGDRHGDLMAVAWRPVR